MSIERLAFGDLHIEGVSRAGEETWFRVRPPGLAFDVGRGANQLTGIRDIFLTHGHLDHALGLPFLLSKRTAHGSGVTRVFVPAAAAGELAQLVEAAESLEKSTYDYEIRPLETGDRVPVGNHLTIEAFATDHGLPSLGYHLLQSRYRLKHEYRDRPPDELAGLRRQGVEFEQEEIVVWLSYCGDTGPGVFDLEPRILQSSVLLLECTFFDEDSRERAREFGHMHLDDLVAHAADFRNDDLILHHLSRRYDCSDVVQRTSERFQLPHTRVHLFGC